MQPTTEVLFDGHPSTVDLDFDLIDQDEINVKYAGEE